MGNDMSNKKALVISGGGSKGAFAGGVVEYLITKKNKDYDLYIASSTGTLIQLFVATNNIDKLKEGYTNVTNDDIWSSNPFKITKNNNGIIKMDLNIWNIIKNILPKFKLIKSNKLPWFSIKKIDGSISFGSAFKLRGLISKFLTQDNYIRFKENTDKEMLACVVNATIKEIEYKSSNNWGYEDFCDWTFASCSAYPFMEPVIKNNMQYIDGATLENVPIQEAINRGATDIDVIILKEEKPKFEAEYLRNLSQGILSVLDLMQSELGNDDVQIGKLKAINSDEEIRLNLYYTPRKLTNNSLVFDKELMNEWWDEGYKYAEEVTCKKYSLIKGRKAKLIKD